MSENKTKAKEEPMLDFNEIKRLVRLLERSQIHEIEIFDKGRKIRLAKATPSDGHIGGFFLQAPGGMIPSPAAVPGTGVLPEPATAASAALGRNVRQVKSPMVGTFYGAPSPDADPYVQVGDMVHKAQVLCIIEAMKLMNEIECEFNGRIVEIHVENAQPVEFDQLLFTIEAAG